MELLAEEVESIARLPWPAGDALHSIDKVLKHSGRTYLAHAEDHACVFLDRQTNLCRIHAQFGMEAKPLGCRLYPFQIVPTFAGEATVTGRYGCPTIRQNSGAPYSEALPELRELSRKMKSAPAFDETTTCGLDRDQVQAVCEFAATMLHGFDRNEQRALFLMALADWLSNLTSDQVDRESLAASFPQLKETVEIASNLPTQRPIWVVRMSFRMYLGLQLRRDEDVLDGRAGRVARMIAMMQLVLGFGSFHALGVVHPKGTVRKAGLFSPRPGTADARPDLGGDAAADPAAYPAPFELMWSMISVKMMSQQFMGSANGKRDLLAGLRTIALIYPFVAAAAKYRAGNRGAGAVEAEDVDYGVAVIEHAFGRSAVLAHGFARSIEKLLLDPAVFLRVVSTV